MHGEIEVDESRGIMEVCSYANSTKADIARAIGEVQHLYETKGYTRILADTTQQERMPNTADVYDVFSQYPRGFKTAILVNQDQDTQDDLEFAETVSRNRGIQIEIFFDRANAIQWLIKD